MLDGLALQLARAFWPGPLTIVAPPERGLAAAVLGGGTTVAVRVPAHAVARALAAAFGFCITATSANRSGEPPAVTGADVAAAFARGPRRGCAARRGAVTGGPPSTIVEMGEDGPRLDSRRRGALEPRARIAQVMRSPARLRSQELRRGSSKPSAETVQRSTPSDRHERAALVGLFNLSRSSSRQVDPEHSLDELAGLAAAAGATVVLRVLQERPRPDPATFLGSGKVQALAASCDELRVDVVIFDNELSPAQLRNLEKALDRKVVDRTQLILDIFARRARTREGKLQVELAQLKYLLPRLVGSSDALSRLGGGIGTRGPGETKLETDRRRIRHRISVLSKEIDVVRRRRAQLRERRQKGAGADGRPRRLHQRRQDDALQRADRRSGGRVGRALRHARSAGAQGPAAGPARAARVGHRRLHRSAAALARGGVSRHARGSRRPRTCWCTSSTRRIPTASGRWRPCAACSPRSAPTRCPRSRSSTSSTGSTPASARGCRRSIRAPSRCRR